MRSPKVVLDNLVTQTIEKEYRYQRLYRNLYNIEFYLDACDKIYPNKGSITKGVTNVTVDGMSIKRIENLIEKLRDSSFKPSPVKRIYIPKKNGKLRPLGLPTFEDKLVQEVVRRILEGIFEPQFSDNSHGFRPLRSCHTALKQIKNTFTGVRWFIEGDIKGFFDNIDHHTLINILRKRIDDERFIDLIWKFLRAGYMEDWKFHQTYTGTPQGGILSPILSNIYLNELDQFMEKYSETVNKGVKRNHNLEYHNLASKINYYKSKNKRVWDSLDKDERTKRAGELKELYKQLNSLDSKDLFDPGYRRIKYVRYADDFLIGVIASKAEAQTIKQDLNRFLADKLKLELSDEKTLITHSNDNAHFLGYDIRVTRDWQTMKQPNGNPKRKFNFQAKLFVPNGKYIKKLIDLGALSLGKNNTWKPTHRPQLIHNDDLEIIRQYNAEIRGFYNYYRLASNVHSLQSFRQTMKFSMLKTFANKYKSTMGKMIRKYSIDGKLGVRYKAKEEPRIAYFIDQKMEKNTSVANEEVDQLPLSVIYSGRTSLVDRLLAGECEWCGITNVPLEIHHVKKLKDLEGKKAWERHMITRKRKTLALCVPCHRKLHNGRLD